MNQEKGDASELFYSKSAYITLLNFDLLLFSPRQTLCPLWFVPKKGVVNPDSVLFILLLN